MTTPLALLSPDADLDARLRRVVGADDADLRRWRDEFLRADPRQVARELADDGVNVVCLGPELDEDRALDLARAFDVDHPEVCVVVLAESPGANLWEGALRAGVRGVVSPGDPDDELGAVLTGALDAAARRRRLERTGGGDDAPSRDRRTIVVLSPKGGAGKTMVSVNLAVILARSTPGEVALFDLDLQFGDVANALQITAPHSLADAARAAGPLDATALKVFLSSHPSSGLWVLAAPESPPDADEVSPSLAVRAARLLSDEFATVVVDTPAGLGEHTVAVAEMATDLVLVSTMDVSAIRSLRKEIDVLDALGLDQARRHLVLNRADARVGLNPRDVEAVLGMPVDLAVPSTRAVPSAINQGIPLIESDPRAAVTRQLEQLAARFAPVAERAPGVRLPWRREAR